MTNQKAAETIPAVRYIKLGPGNLWAERALRDGELHLGHSEVPHELALSGDPATIISHLVARGRSPGKAKDFAREISDFYRLGDDAIWITFAHDRLWWAHAAPEVVWLGEAADHGARVRRTVSPWCDTDAKGAPLRTSELSSKLTKVAAYRQTVCGVEASDYLLRKLAGENEPLIDRAQKALNEAAAAAEGLIEALHWSDFETLVDLLLARGGWHRSSALGGHLKDVDMIVEQPVTGETAFVQVKSAANQSVLDDYIARFELQPAYSRLIFACHSAKGFLSAGGRQNVTLWTRQGLAQAAVRNGLMDWLIARAM